MTERAHRAAVLERIADAISAVFNSVGELRDAVYERHAALPPSRRALRRGDLATLRPRMLELLERHRGLAAGMGVVCASGALEDAAYWLEWSWYRRQGTGARRLIVNLDPGDPGFFDYETAEWFAVPRQTGERYVAGPFVDYSGTDQHIFTLSMPIVVGDGFFGVAGADVRLTELESVVIPALRSLPPDAVLVNAEGRIIASNSGRHLPGRLLVSDDARWLGEVAGQWGERADGASLARHERLPWTLVELPSRR